MESKGIHTMADKFKKPYDKFIAEQFLWIMDKCKMKEPYLSKE